MQYRLNARVAAFACTTVLLGACKKGPQDAGTSPASPPSAGSETGPPPAPPLGTLHVYNAMIAMNGEDARAGKNGGAEAFVFLRESAELAPGAELELFVVARDAYFEVLQDGRFPAPKPYTAFLPRGGTCVGVIVAL